LPGIVLDVARTPSALHGAELCQLRLTNQSDAPLKSALTGVPLKPNFTPE
jgi:hypothetical protein